MAETVKIAATRRVGGRASPVGVSLLTKNTSPKLDREQSTYKGRVFQSQIESHSGYWPICSTNPARNGLATI
ncbi:hypothetical protein D3C85_939780 [compost metagenome]